MGSWIRAILNEKPSLPVCAGVAAFFDFGSQENKSVPFSSVPYSVVFDPQNERLSPGNRYFWDVLFTDSMI